jgi:hypothetical protein
MFNCEGEESGVAAFVSVLDCDDKRFSNQDTDSSDTTSVSVPWVIGYILLELLSQVSPTR